MRIIPSVGRSTASSAAAEASIHSQSRASVYSPGIDWSRWLLPAMFTVITGVGLALRVPLLWSGELDYDEGVYWMSLHLMSAGHPLFRSIYSSQPPAFLELIQPVYAATGHSLAGARLAVLLISLLGGLALVRLLAITVGPSAALVAALLVATDPLAIRSSVTLQADAPSVWLGVVALTLVFEARRHDGLRAATLMVLSGGTYALAVLTKLLVVAYAVPLAALILTDALSTQGSRLLRWRTFLGRSAQAAAGAAVVAAAVLLPYLGTWHLLWAQVITGHLRARGIDSGGVASLTPTLKHELPIAVLAGLGLLLTWWRDHRYALVLTSWVAASIALLLTQRPVFPHHVVIIVPPLIALAVASLGYLKQTSRRQALIAAVALVTAASLLKHAPRAAPTTADSSLVNAIRAVTPAGATIVTDEQYVAVGASRDTPPPLVDTSFVRLASTGVTAQSIEGIIESDNVATVCFATGRLIGVPGLTGWVQTHFLHHERIAGAMIYWR